MIKLFSSFANPTLAPRHYASAITRPLKALNFCKPFIPLRALSTNPPRYSNEGNSSGRSALYMSIAMAAGIMASSNLLENKKKTPQKDTSLENTYLQEKIQKKGPILDLRNLNLSTEDLSQLSNRLDCHPNKFRRLLIEQSSTEAVSQQLLSTVRDSFRSYQDRPNHYTCVQLAAIAYDDEDKIKKSSLPDGWEFIDCKNFASTTGYFGASFVNHSRGQVVLAHRGTYSPYLKSLYADAFGVVKGVVEGQQESALNYTKEVLEKTEEWGYTLGIVGHSLGGWLAQLTTCWCASQGIDHVYAVTIDPPGAKSMLGTYLKGRMIAPMRETNLNQLDILSFVSTPNHVNSCNEQVGELQHIIPSLAAIPAERFSLGN